ncbi:MAG: c-type cytochrome biogenesis protein CcsB [Sciscionella sp.]
MPVNEVLSKYSDWSFVTALVIYVLAMIFYLIEQAFGRVRASAVAAPAQQFVTAGGGGVVETPPAGRAPSGGPDRGRVDRIGRMAVALTVLGAVIHFASIVLRGLAAHRWPLGNMYEYIAFITFVAVVGWLVAVRRFEVRRLGAWVLLPILVLMFLNGTIFYTLAAPVRPALQSYWLMIHVTIISASSGILLLPGMASLFYLIKGAGDGKDSMLGRFAAKLPSRETLDRVAYRTTIFALPLFTFGVMCGAIWAESAWGSFWSWDPKETTALVDWICYAAYLHSRATAGWRGNRAAAINVLGFAVNIFNLFFINLVTTGLHSYAGLP